MSDVEFTDEMRDYAARQFELYERKIEMMWYDMTFELEMKFGLEEGEGDKLLDRSV